MNIQSHQDKVELIKKLNAMMPPFNVEIKQAGTRSLSQNSALHLAMKQLSDTLNDGGLSMTKVLKEGIEINWTAETAKERLFRPIMIAVTGKDSSAKLGKTEMSKVYDILMKHLGERFGIFVPFPSRHN